jgi:hypothetical protein
MHRGLLIGLVVLTSFSGASPDTATAWSHIGSAYNNASIADGELFACFQNNTPVYTHRGILMSGLRKWGDAIIIQIESLGRCDNDGSNVQVWYSGQPFGNSCGSTWSGSFVPQQGTYSQIDIYFNASCGAGKFWWGGTNPVPNGQIDAYSTIMHEMGHAYGLDESQFFILTEQVMEANSGCVNGSKRFANLSSDDADGLRQRYLGLPHQPNPTSPIQANAICID